MKLQNGSLKVFTILGITVWLSWTWILIPLFYPSLFANQTALLPQRIAEFIALFLIVLTHEFGHALACRSVGGTADRITLWPLGGVAYVKPPPRPAAFLWSIAAGPLVNVILIPLTLIPAILLGSFSHLNNPNQINFGLLGDVAVMNIVILVFNLLPVYPLDGGQILQALLWFILGRAVSLFIVACVGLLGGSLLLVYAILHSDNWFIYLAAYMLVRSVIAIRIALSLRKIESAPRYHDLHCPNCQESPPAGNFWSCPCGAKFDIFLANAQCPNCHRPFNVTACTFCLQSTPIPLWSQPITPPIQPAPAF